MQGPSVLQEAQRNLAVLFRTRFTTLWRSEFHINLKIEAGVAFVCAVKYISIKDSEGSLLVKCACVYGVCSVKNNIENETNLTDCTSNLT
jgi:hypothetical protein